MRIAARPYPALRRRGGVKAAMRLFSMGWIPRAKKT